MPPGVATYYAPDGRDRQTIVLSCSYRGELAFAGVVLLALRVISTPSRELMATAENLTAELLAAGDARVIRPYSA